MFKGGFKLRKNKWKVKLDTKNENISFEMSNRKSLNDEISLNLSTTPIGFNMKRISEKQWFNLIHKLGKTLSLSEIHSIH